MKSQIVNGVEIFRRSWWQKCFDDISWHYKRGSLPVQKQALVQSAESMGELSKGAGEQRSMGGLKILSPLPLCTSAPLPLPSPVYPAPCSISSTGNEIMVQLFNACEQHGLELLEDGIYQNDVKLGQAGCTNGNWWFTSATQAKPEKIFCDSAADAVWLLQIPDSLPTANEYLQYHPLEKLSPGELQGLFETAALVAV